MILSALAALLTALGPLLGGADRLGPQVFFHLAVIGGLSLWAASRVFLGHFPLPSRRALAWTGLLAASSAVSVALSPIHYAARHEWYVFLDALWLFPAMTALSRDQRIWIDQSIRWSAWVLMMLAFYQHFSLGETRPDSTLMNENVYAGAVLMLLPLALETRDWLLAAGLAWSLWWTRSVGAWLGLSLALAWTQRGRRPAAAWLGKIIALVCAVALYAKLGSPDALHRWWWWKAAAAMFADRPVWGYGPGAFPYVLPAYVSVKASGLYSAYAHQYLLETAAEYGLLFSALWFGGLWHCVRRVSSHKRFGVIAALIHSFWDYALFVPSNLWLFCYCAASSIPDSPEGVNISSRYKSWLVPAILGLGALLSWRALLDWKGCRLEAAGQEALRAGHQDVAARRFAEARALIPDDPELPRLEAELDIRRGQSVVGTASVEAMRAAAEDLERAVGLNPYRPSGWTALEFAYRRIGRPDLAQGAVHRAQAYQSGP